jgi:hypothetical protein
MIHDSWLMTRFIMCVELLWLMIDDKIDHCDQWWDLLCACDYDWCNMIYCMIIIDDWWYDDWWYDYYDQWYDFIVCVCKIIMMW